MNSTSLASADRATPAATALSAASTALAVRRAARSGSLAGHTSGLAAEYVQGNIVILPAALGSAVVHASHRMGSSKKSMS
jgi:uncharacterized protein YcsI (UPF0317 family)